MDGDDHRDIARESSLDSSMSSTCPVSSNTGAGEIMMSEPAGCLVPHRDAGSPLDALMKSMSLGSGSGTEDALTSEAAGGYAETEKESQTDSSVKSVTIPSEEEDFSLISMTEDSSKGGVGGSSVSELSQVFNPLFEETALGDGEDRFTPVELRASPERGYVVADVSRDGGFMYRRDQEFNAGSLDSPIAAAVSEESTLPSFDDITPEELRLTSTPIGGRVVGDPGSGRAHLYIGDLDTTDPCSPIPFRPSKDAQRLTTSSSLAGPLERRHVVTWRG